jgi:putative addiction module component (TIGR02574 family)
MKAYPEAISRGSPRAATSSSGGFDRCAGGERRSKVRVIDFPEITRLSTPEKILLVEDLWDTIALDEAGVPVPQSHKEELDRRLNSAFVRARS